VRVEICAISPVRVLSGHHGSKRHCDLVITSGVIMLLYFLEWELFTDRQTDRRTDRRTEFV